MHLPEKGAQLVIVKMMRHRDAKHDVQTARWKWYPRRVGQESSTLGMFASETPEFGSLVIETNIDAIGRQVRAQRPCTTTNIQDNLAAGAHARVLLNASADRRRSYRPLDRVVHRRVGCQGVH